MPMRSIRLVALAAALAAAGGCGPHAAPQPMGHFAAAPVATPRPTPDTAVRQTYQRVLDQVAAEPGAVRTRSGLVYRDLSQGSGPAPRESDTVTVRYQVKAPDGRVVEDSTTSGDTVTVALTAIRPCVREAMLRMRVGGVSRFICPWSEEDGGSPAAPAPVVVEATLVAVGQPLPPPGH
jgi:FKBP-type peptidyl-prolyl cis-trans isomerase FkpA